MASMLTTAKRSAGFTIITTTIFVIGRVIERIAPVERAQLATLNVGYAIFYSFARSAATTLLPSIPLVIDVLRGGLIKLPSGGWAVVFSIIVYIVAKDFAEYLFHRVQHACPQLWALHAVHHSDSSVNVTTTTRQHWVDIFIKLIKVSFGSLAAVLNNPQYHRLHHSNSAQHQNKSFGALFPVFDLLFGTYYPSSSEYPTTGIEGQRGLSRILEAVAWPMI